MIVTPEKSGPVDAQVTAPPSKSYTHRALITGALGSGTTVVHHPLYAEDTELTIRALLALGIPVEADPFRVTLTGCDGELPSAGEITLNLNNSGTSLRLLASLALLRKDPVVLTGSRRMQERPVGPLAGALRDLGGSVAYLGKDGFPPLRVGGRLKGGPVTIDGSISSQFISSVLLAAPYAEEPVVVRIPAPPASQSYLDITLGVMKSFGVDVERNGYSWFGVKSGQRYRGMNYEIEGDYSSASYFFAIAAICGGKVTVDNLRPDSVQGDRRFLDALAAMGCSVSYGADAVTVGRTGPLTGISFDMSSSPDTVQTLCMVAAMAGSPTTITGIGQLKYKESDRINGTAERLRALGGDVTVGEDSLTIRPAELRGGTIDPADDHRTAMSFAVLGLGTGGITITGAECVAKSFPEFWEILAEVR